MKKFIDKITILAGILVIIVVILNGYYEKVYPDNDGTDKFRNVPEGIQIANLGSSHGERGFCYDDISDKYTCFNFALSSQRTSYDYRVIEYYKDKLVRGGILFVPISYQTFFGVNEELEDSFESKNKRYYKFLPKESIKLYDEKTAIFVKFPLLVQYDKLISVPFEIEEDDIDKITFSNAELKKYAERAVKRHIVDKIDENGDMILNNEDIDAVYRIIELCYESDIVPVLVTTPFLKEYTDSVCELKPDFFQTFNEIISDIQSKTGVKYFNYAEDIRFCKSYELFRDADHLNEDGAKEFVTILVREVVEPLSH